MQTETMTMGEQILANHVSSAACVAAAVMLDNNMTENMTSEERTSWWGLADMIENVMRHADEPRFTLYDYLDAAVNRTDGQDWIQTAASLEAYLVSDREEGMDAALELLTSLAEKKRRTYGGEF